MLHKKVILYLLKFAGAFAILYYGTLAIEGLAAPEGRFYSPFIQQYLNYVSWLRASLMYGTRGLLSLFGFTIDIISPVYMRQRLGSGVHMGYDCLGYGVFSFWLAFVFANRARWQMKLKWMLAGILVLWMINVIRISLLLVATNKKWSMPLGWDHHTWFNIAAYGAIFFMMWVFDRQLKKQENRTPAAENLQGA